MASRTSNPILNSVEFRRPSEPKILSDVLDETAFHRVISLERKRSERSQRPFVLLLIDTGRSGVHQMSPRVLDHLLLALQSVTRETDVAGWYAEGVIVGVMFTEIDTDQNRVLSTILTRVGAALRERLDSDQFNRIKFSFHVFPDHWDPNHPERRSNPVLYPDLEKRGKSDPTGRIAKRVIDVAGTTFLLLLLSPVFLIVAIAIKLTSRGPVLFRQTRIGQHGKPFTFLKFRSMYANNDASEHKKYVLELIRGEAKKKPSDGNASGVFKLTDDARITTVGKFLRRSSMDELPQLINVLLGEMSLVGPRPPLSYEVEAYEVWHRRRLLEAKPGITGLWQVHGRSRVEFDDMVRLDLRYARECSPWLDIKILLQTPKAVIAGDGAC